MDCRWASSAPAAGLVIGLLFVAYINDIADVLGMDHRPGSVRSVDLLLPEDSDDRRAVHGGVDRGRRHVDRRVGQHSAGVAAPPGCIPWRPCAMSSATIADRFLAEPARPRSARAVARWRPARPFALGTPRRSCNCPPSDCGSAIAKGTSRFPCCAASTWKCARASSCRSSARAARARARCCTCWARSTRPTKARSSFTATASTTCRPRQRDALRNKQFGMIFQFYHLLPELTALENVLSPLMIAEGVLELLAPSPAAHRAGPANCWKWSACRTA